MPRAPLVEEFVEKTDNKLLRDLLKVYQEALELSEDQQMSRLVDQMKAELEERCNADS